MLNNQRVICVFARKKPLVSSRFSLSLHWTQECRRHVTWTCTWEDDPAERFEKALSHGRRLNVHVESVHVFCALFIAYNWLVVYLPLWKIWKSMGRMTSHILWKIKNVWNHQPDNIQTELLSSTRNDALYKQKGSWVEYHQAQVASLVFWRLFPSSDHRWTISPIVGGWLVVKKMLTWWILNTYQKNSK